MDFDLRFSDKEITAWGGMAVMKRMLEHLNFDAALKTCGLPQPGSNRGYQPKQLITQFMLSVWCGAMLPPLPSLSCSDGTGFSGVYRHPYQIPSAIPSKMTVFHEIGLDGIGRPCK